MGLKNKLSKMKNFLFDEVEEEKETKKTFKNKALKKDSEKLGEEHKEQKKDIIEELFLEESEKEDKNKVEEIKPRQEKHKFNFREFDDDDFMVAQKRPEPLIKKEIKKEPKRVLYQGSKLKNDNKKFTPSPIISPIYGLLDEEGNMVKNDSKKERKKEVTFDSVRQKAYGKKEELDDTIKDLKSKTIEEVEKEMEEKLSREKRKKSEEKELKSYEMIDDDDDDDMILPSVNFKEIDVDKETVKSKKKITPKKIEVDDDDDDTKEQDLFNLIDTMYQKEGDDK